MADLEFLNATSEAAQLPYLSMRLRRKRFLFELKANLVPSFRVVKVACGSKHTIALVGISLLV